MASNETLNSLFEMMIERLQNVETKINKVLEKKSEGLLQNMCHCQISTLEISKSEFKLITKSPVYGCKSCKHGISTSSIINK